MIIDNYDDDYIDNDDDYIDNYDVLIELNDNS